MKILLISPASGKWRRIGRRRLFNGRTFRFSMLPLLMVARMCPEDSDIRLIDEQVEDTPLDETFDVVGITCMTATAPRAFELCRHFRQRKIPVVLGGFFPTLNPHLALEHCDAAVIGPAMEAWPRLLEDLKAGRLQKQYRGNPNGRIPALLPRQLLNRQNYSTVNSVYATMGCRNRCKFCSISAVYDAHHYQRPIEEVIEEISSFKTRFFMFVDDNLTQDRDYIRALLRRLVPLRKKWVTQASIEIAEEEELLTLLHKAGCVGVFIGLESFNEKNLNQHEKEFNRPARYKQIADTFHRHGIFVQAGMIFGFEGDDVHVFESTLKMLEEVGIDVIQTAIMTPLPGTPLYEEMKDRILDTDWEHYDYRHVVFRPRRITAEQLQAGADWVIRKYYSPWRILKRTLRWLTAPGGLRNFIYPFVLNWAYYGRVKVFKISGYNPAVAGDYMPALSRLQTVSLIQ
jgi:radical SAM superfamily enzyme YgiQ (UPF0313 family)